MSIFEEALFCMEMVNQIESVELYNFIEQHVLQI